MAGIGVNPTNDTLNLKIPKQCEHYMCIEEIEGSLRSLDTHAVRGWGIYYRSDSMQWLRMMRVSG